MIAGSRHRSTGRLVCFALAVSVGSMRAASAQDGRSTVNEVEILLNRAPAIEAGELSGLRKFSSNVFDNGLMTLKVLGTIAAALLVAPGLAIFYCGLSGRSDRTQSLMRYLFLAAMMSLFWILWIYSLAFSRNENSFDIDKREIHAIEGQYRMGSRFIGGFEHLALRGFESNLQEDSPKYSLRRVDDKIPHLLFMTFEMMLFIAAAAPLAVLFAARWRLPSATFFFAVWGTLIYAPIAYWVWGGGWHAATIDSAGGIVTHLTVGCSALALALALNRRIQESSVEPQLEPAWLGLGTLLFWGGSLAVNSSHTLDSIGGSANGILVTHLAACTGVVGWTVSEWLARGTAGLVGICFGAMSGLFAIAPACGAVPAQSAMLIGLIAGGCCQLAHSIFTVRLPKNVLLVPAALQGTGGGIGALLSGIFATPNVAGFNRRGDEIRGLLSGNPDQFGVQFAAVGCAAALATTGTFLLCRVFQYLDKERID